MIICKRRYRIVTDNHAGYEVQKRTWYFPFWYEIKNKEGLSINTHYTIESAEKLIDMDKAKSRKPKHRVVKTFNCG